MKNFYFIGNDLILRAVELKERNYGRVSKGIRITTINFDANFSNSMSKLTQKGSLRQFMKSTLAQCSSSLTPDVEESLKNSYLFFSTLSPDTEYFTLFDNASFKTINTLEDLENLIVSTTVNKGYLEKELIQTFKNYNIDGKYLTKGKSKFITDWNDKTKKGRSFKILRYYAGFDTEYKDPQGYESDLNSLDDSELKNLRESMVEHKIVSYQVSKQISEGVFINDVIFMKTEMRYSLQFFIGTIESDFANMFGFKYFETTYVAHKNIVDITKLNGLRDDVIINKLMSINNCLATKESIYIHLKKANRHKKVVGKFNLRDSLLLVPPMSLRKLGEKINFSKIIIDEETIKNMDNYVKEDLKGFYKYAVRDSQITAKFSYSYYPDEYKRMPITIAGYAQSLFINFLCARYGWNKDEFDYIWRGTLKVAEFNKKEFKKRETIKAFTPICALNYYGGRNETFRHGYFEGNFLDIDMSGYYPLLGSMIPFLDYSKPPLQVAQGYMSDNTFNFDEVQVGYCQVNFDYKDVKDKFVRGIATKTDTGNGLIYVNKGENIWVSIQELKSAYKMGCEIYIHNGFIFCTDLEYENPLRAFMTDMRGKRNEARLKFGKKSPEQEIFKLIMNSITGKMGQGSTGKKVYDLYKNITTQVETSAIENAPYIATITAMGRAAITELMNMFILRTDSKICNVVTDGFMVELDNFKTDDEINAFIFEELKKNPNLYPNLVLYKKELDKAGFKSMVETKHKGKTLLLLKTRGAMLIGLEESDTQFSLTGYKLNKEMANLTSSELIKKFLPVFKNRKGLIENTSKSLMNTKDFYREGKELSRLVTKQLNFNYDYKRKGLLGNNDNPEHIYSFETEIFKDIQEFYKVKKIYQRNKEIAIKSVEDIEKIDFIEGLRYLPFKFNKNYTINSMITKLLCALSFKGVLYYEDVKIDNYKLLEGVLMKENFDYDKTILKNDYYRKQKIKDEHIEICLQENNLFMINTVIKNFIGTDKLQIKKAR